MFLSTLNLKFRYVSLSSTFPDTDMGNAPRPSAHRHPVSPHMHLTGTMGPSATLRTPPTGAVGPSPSPATLCMPSTGAVGPSPSPTLCMPSTGAVGPLPSPPTLSMFPAGTMARSVSPATCHTCRAMPVLRLRIMLGLPGKGCQGRVTPPVWCH